MAESAEERGLKARENERSGWRITLGRWGEGAHLAVK